LKFYSPFNNQHPVSILSPPCAFHQLTSQHLLQVDDSKYSFAADEASLRLPAAAALQAAAAGGRQDDSSGSEGFCDQEPRRPSRRVHTETERTDRDSDSSDEGIKVSELPPL